MTTRKIVLKKVKVGTPIKTVTAGSFGINNLGGVDTTGRTTGSLLAFNQSSGNFEPVTLTGDSNHFLTFDSSSTPDTLQINFTNDSISGSLIPKLDSAFDLGSSTKKWKDLFLSGSTITLGDLTIQSTGGGIEVKDSDGNTLLQNIKYITVNGDTDILAYDSNTSTFTFNDSDIARTDEIETFHKAIKVTDSAEITSNLTVGGNLTVVGDLQYDDVSADSAVFSGSVAIGNNLTADSATITKIANTTLTGKNATFDSATIGNLAATNLVISSGDSAFFNKVAIGDLEVDSANIDRLTLDSGQVRQLSTGFINADSAFMDSATISTIATGTINADQQFTDSATITNIANSVLTAKVITNTTLTNATLTSDSATITNIASSQLTIDNATFDSSAHNTLHANALTVDSGDIRQLSVDFINADSAFFDSATITNLSTSQITFSQATLDSATINTLNADSSDIRQFSTEFINFDSAFGDSATITNIANTQLTGSQATLDSATITKLNVDSSDIDHLSTEAINFDSATGDSATITSIANSTFTGKVITGTNVAFDSATITNVAIATQLTGDQASFDSVASNTLHATNLSVDSGDIRQLSVDFINADSAFLDSATITTLAVGTLNIDAINIGDSATFTNIASNSINTNALQVDDITINGSEIQDAGDFTLNVEGDITLDANGADVKLSDDGLHFGTLSRSVNDLVITSPVQDGDIVFKGDDGGSSITAFTLDMSEAGTATFNSGINLPDNGKLQLGASQDLQIYHDGNNSIISDEGTGGLFLRGTNTVDIQSALGHNYLKSTINEGTKIYYNNSERFETTDSGVHVTGQLLADSATLTKLTVDSATITNIANSVLTAKEITGTTVTTSGDIVSSGTIRAGNLNVDSADIIKISRDNLASGTGVTYDSSTGNISIGQPVATTDSVTFSGLTIGGDLVVSGTTTTVATTNTTMTDQLFELGNGRTGTPTGDAGIVIEMGDDSNAFMGFDQSLGKFVVSRTNATGSSTGNLVHTTAPLVANAIEVDSADITKADIDSADITTLTGDSAVFSSAIQTPKIITPDFTIDSNRMTIGGNLSFDFLGGGVARVGINKSSSIGNEGVLSTHALAVKGDAYFLDRSAGFSIELIPDTDPVVFRADNRTGAAYAGIDFKIGNGNPALDNTVMKLNNIGMELKGDLSRTSGDMTFDMPANIVLDADGGSIKLSDGGTQFGELLNSSSDFLIDAKVQDKDIKFRGDDGGSVITALTLDMSNAGAATFNDAVIAPKADIDSADIRQLTTEFIHGDSAVFDSATITTLAVGTLNIDNINIGDSATFTNVAVSTALNTNSLIVDDFTVDGSTITNASSNDVLIDANAGIILDADDNGTISFRDGGTRYGIVEKSSNDFHIQSMINDGDLKILGKDGSTTITAVTFDMSDAGRALFNGSIDIGGTSITRTGDLTIEPSGDLILDAGGENIKFHDDGVEVGQIDMGSQNLTIRSSVQDKDTIFVGNDGGSEIVGMIIDYSEGGRVGIGTGSPSQLLEVSGNGGKSRFTRTGSNGVVMEFVSGSTASGLINVAGTGTLGLGGGSRENDLTIDASGNVVTSSLRVGNFNVDSADVITISKSGLSTGSPDALTYDSAAGQFALNANHVMALIQTVDSNGSGLNADTLEGQAGSHYRINVYNASGTLLN